MESQRTQVFLHGLFMHLDSSITRLSGKIFVISVGLHRETVKFRWGILHCASIFASQHAGIRQSKCCGVLGCSCREMMRNKQPFLTAPAFFSNLCTISCVICEFLRVSQGIRKKMFHSVSRVTDISVSLCCLTIS